MAQSEKALITETSLTDAADAIREKLEVENTYLPSEMGPAIRSIKTMAVSANGNTLVLTGNGASSTGSGTEYDAISVNGQTRAIKDTTAREGLTGKVPTTRTINNKQLNANITLDANDISYDDDPEAERVVGSVASALFQRPQYNQVVRVDGEQSLTDAQKETARGNIDAASVGEVSELKSALNYSELATVNGLSQVGYSVDLHLEQGEIAGNTGTPVSAPNSKRVRSKNHIAIAPNTTYHVTPKSHTFYIFFYDANKAHISGQDIWGKYQPFDIVLPSGAFYMKVMVGNNADTDIVPTDVVDSERPICVGNGTLAVEVSQARGNEPTLDARLDNIDIAADSFYGFTYDLPFEQGAIGGTGSPYGSNTNIRTGFIKVMPSKYKVEVNGYRAYALFYDKTKTFINGRNIWGKTADFEFETDESVGYVRLVANLTSGEEITPVDNALTLIDLGLYKDTKYLIDSTPIIPGYFFADNYLANKEAAITENCLVTKGTSFLFITDIHLEANSKSSKSIVKHVIDNTPVPFIITGGDIPTAYSATAGNEKAELLKDIQDWMSWVDWWGQDRVYQLRGNHDYVKPARNDATKYYNVPDGGVHQIVMSKIIERVHAPNPEMNYYYFDNETQKIRFIVIDGHKHNDNYPAVVVSWIIVAQINWLIDTLNSSDGYSIVLLSHEATDPEMPSYATNLAIVQSIAEAYKNKGTVAEVASGASIHADFSNVTGELICILSGHCHKDASHVSNGVLSITTTCDAYYNNDPNVTRTQGTITESAFDVFSIDTTNKTIKTVRIGGGSNRGWNYVTGEDIE